MSGENTTATIMNVTTSVPILDALNKTKIGMAVGLLLSVFIVTLLPFIIVRHLSKRWGLENKENSRIYKIFTTWMSRINCFAGGVFLSTGFMDIFPEMLESIEEAKKKNNVTNEFPLGPFLTLLGFFMILIIEETVTFIKTHFYGNKVTPIITDNAEVSIRGYGSDFDPENLDTNKIQKQSTRTLEFHEHSLDHTHHEHHEHGLDAEALSRGNLSVTILMIAISVHSIFEGLALGLQKDQPAAYRLFLALCLHKYIIAITIGLQISKSSLGIRMACLCSAIFAFATPIGVILGFWVMHLEQIGDTSFSMVSGVLQGLACGTFFYIVFFEILPEEFSKRYDKLLKVISLILGFALVSVFMLVFHE